MNLNNFNNINPKQIAELKLKAYKFEKQPKKNAKNQGTQY